MENPENYQVRQDLRQSEEYGKYMEDIGWTIRQAQGRQIFIKKLGWVSIAKIQRTKGKLPEKEIDKILKDCRVFMCKFEPDNNAPFNPPLKLRGENPDGFHQDSWLLLGTKTLRVNLRPAEKEIFDSFKKDARYILRKLQIDNLQFSIDKFEEFYEIWKKSAKRKNLWIPGKKEYESLIHNFKDKAFCITVNDAGCVVLTHEKTAFYYYAGSTEEALKNNLPYAIVWEAMKKAKKMGCEVWDFEGIYDKRWPNKKWLGFSHFKKSFGGIEIEYPGCFTRWRWPFS